MTLPIPIASPENLANERIDFLVWLHLASLGIVDRDAYPSKARLDAARRKGLTRPAPEGWPLPLPSDRGVAMMRAACRKRANHAEDLPFGPVYVTGGPFVGETGTYDDEELDPIRGLTVEGWEPDLKAIVYLKFPNGRHTGEYALIPHHLLEVDESWS